MQGSTVLGVVEGIVADMTAAAAGTPQPSRRPFADATPAQIRDALGDEEAADPARQRGNVLDRAKDRLDLSEVHEVLDTWPDRPADPRARRGEGHRRMLADAEERARTGKRPAGHRAVGPAQDRTRPGVSRRAGAP